MSLSNPGNNSIIVSDLIADGASVDTASVRTVAGFPAENVLDPQPEVRWRVNIVREPSTNNQITLDLLRLDGQTSIPFTPGYNYFGAYFHNSHIGAVAPFNTWRIRTAETAADTTANPNFDSGIIDLWTPVALSLDPGTVKDPWSYFPPGVTSHHLVGQILGGGGGGNADIDRFVRFDFNTPDNELAGLGFFEIGRIVIGKAIRVLVPAPGERPTPVGTPARPVVTWDAVMNRARYEEFMYTLARERGSSPRLLRSWGHDVFPLDGAGTVAAIQDVEAADPWTRHQGTVYGYLESVTPVSVRGDMHRFRVTFRSL